MNYMLDFEADFFQYTAVMHERKKSIKLQQDLHIQI